MTSTETGKAQDPSAIDPVARAAKLAEMMQRANRVMQDFADREKTRVAASGAQLPTIDPFNIMGAFTQATQRLMADPERLMRAQFELMNAYADLWRHAANRMMGVQADPVVETPKSDKRFKDPAWAENAVFDIIKQSYLLSARWINNLVNEVEGLSVEDARKVDFYTRQMVDAMSPSNFVMTNPTVLKETIESGGENLVRGLENMIDDLERGRGQLLVKMTDLDAFEVGRNIATTPGKVIYQNELIQLIQYEPTTETVAKRPLIIFPPWINKFYILDLKPANSFIRWAVDQGLTVFVVSWVNPGEDLADKTFEDYMDRGVFDSLTAIEKITGEREVNAIGYCVGGTLLSATLAYMKAIGDDRIQSATFFTALVDFADAGEVKVFVDEPQIQRLEAQMDDTGYLGAEALHTTFNLLRSNDLIWSFVVNNYLMGKDPFPFDLLYWNSDSTRMPKAMHSYYLRNMYLNNLLTKPGGITLRNVKIDLRDIDVPTVIVSTKEDHIAPWKSTYVATQLYKGPVKFILGASGHIAGIVNPPAANKYSYWTNTKNPKEPEDWLAGATPHEGSWWPEWARWIGRHAGGKVPARQPGAGGLPILEEAPGSYVKERAM